MTERTAERITSTCDYEVHTGAEAGAINAGIQKKRNATQPSIEQNQSESVFRLMVNSCFTRFDTHRVNEPKTKQITESALYNGYLLGGNAYIENDNLCHVVVVV